MCWSGEKVSECVGVMDKGQSVMDKGQCVGVVKKGQGVSE